MTIQKRRWRGKGWRGREKKGKVSPGPDYFHLLYLAQRVM
jgi:hypothetical protein